MMMIGAIIGAVPVVAGQVAGAGLSGRWAQPKALGRPEREHRRSGGRARQAAAAAVQHCSSRTQAVTNQPTTTKQTQ